MKVWAVVEVTSVCHGMGDYRDECVINPGKPLYAKREDAEAEASKSHFTRAILLEVKGRK